MALIKDKAQLKGLIRTAFINANTNLPDFEFAEEKYLLPYIGQSLYEELTAVAEAAVPENPTTDQANDLELLKRCRRVVAPMAYLLDLPLIHANLTDMGLQTVATENRQTAHRWEYQEVKEHFTDRGAMAIESLLNYLFAHTEDFPDWLDTDAYKEVSSLVFKSGDQFNKYFTLEQPHRIFWELRPLIREVEDFYIIPSMGEAFFEGLKTSAAPTEKEAKVLVLIKKAVAQLTIAKAIEKLSCKLTTKGFTILLSAGNSDATNSGDAQVKDNQLSLLYQTVSKTGEDYILQLKEYLNANATTLVFPTYYGSSYYAAPVVESEIKNPNECKRIFGML